MAANLWARFNLGRALTPLEVELRRVTDSDLIDLPPKDALTFISQSSQVADNRREIMRHLQECLSESSGARWRRVRGGLVLLEHLLKTGCPVLMSEISEGMHFDPVQRLTFLEKFEYRDDLRVQGMVRQKATALRADVIARMESNSDEPAAQTQTGGSGAGSSKARSTDADAPKGLVGFGSDDPAPGFGGSSSSANVDAAAFGWEDRPPTPKKQTHVNGLVSVGHRDDTDSESDHEASRPTRPRNGGASGGGGNVVAVPRRRPLEDSTDSDSDTERRPARHSPAKPSAAAAAPKPGGWPGADAPAAGGYNPQPAAKAPAATVDLLDL